MWGSEEEEAAAAAAASAVPEEGCFEAHPKGPKPSQFSLSGPFPELDCPRAPWFLFWSTTPRRQILWTLASISWWEDEWPSRGSAGSEEDQLPAQENARRPQEIVPIGEWEWGRREREYL